jgi:hypothetical protein
MAWFSKATKPADMGFRVLTAAARRVDVGDRQEARQMRALRQGWASDAWTYRDAIGELRYAVNFLSNCSARMRLFAAAYPVGGETDKPEPLAKVAGIPEEVVSIAEQGLIDLGHGKLALSHIMKDLSSNMSVAGECWLLGLQDEETGEAHWSIRSVDEIIIKDDHYTLREIPADQQGIIPWVQLDPKTTVLSRIWCPHPRFRLLADSPMRAMLDDCESVTILRRGIRATGRSRLSTGGILLIPNEVSMKSPIDDNGDPMADPFMSGLTEAMMLPIADEGVASAVVPIVLRGPADAMKEVRRIDMASTHSAEDAKVREELIGIIATTFDLPKEVITGVADLNHWSAWNVDDNTFRHHVEPHVIECCESLTKAYMHEYLEAAGVPRAIARRVVIWYDATELVTHPDQTKDGLELHDRLVLSDEAMLRIAGFTDADKPAKSEIQVRLLEKMRTWPPNLVMAFLHAWDPTLIAPPMVGPPAVPGISPTGVDTGDELKKVLEPAPAAPAAPVGAVAPPAAAKPAAGGPPEAQRQLPAPPPQTASGAEMMAPEDFARAVAALMAPEPVVASATSEGKGLRTSRRLVAIDQDLRARLQVAASQAMLSQLERAGERIKKTPAIMRDDQARARIAHKARYRWSAALGKEVLTAAGLSADQLLGKDWTGLKAKFMSWTAAAGAAAIVQARKLGDVDEATVAQAESKMAADRDAAWALLATQMTDLSHSLLYQPDPNAGEAELNPDTLVPTGVIRAALGVAGGGNAEQAEAGQVATGETITGLVEAGGGQREGWVWSHSPSTLHPFEPHEALDGLEFESFTDERLANTTGFPSNQYLLPGDHDGCSCDASPVFLAADEVPALEPAVP